MRKFKELTALVLAAVMLAGCQVSVPVPDETDGQVQSAEEHGPYRPQDDFFMYVNEEALANAVFEYGEIQAGSAFDSKLVDDQIEAVVNGAVAGSGYEIGSEEYIIQQAYNLYLNYDEENAEVPEEIDAVMHEIDEVSSIDEFLMLDARLARDYAVTSYFNVTVDFNYLDSDHRIICLPQYSGIIDADFKTLDDTFAPLNGVKNTSSSFLQAMGHDKDYSDQTGNELGQIVMDIYSATDLEVVDELMTFMYFQVASYDELQEVLSNVDLEAYFTAMGYDAQYLDEFGYVDIGQIAALNDALTEENLEALKAWELVKFGMAYRQFVIPCYDALSNYATIDYATREEQAMDFVRSTCAAQTDPIYVEQYYSQETDDALISMCDDIRESYRALISQASWLSEETRQGLLEKLDNIIYVTGSGVTRTDPSEYSDLNYDDLFSFILSYRLHENRDKTEQLSVPVDRTESYMPMQTFNACYNPTFNNITITCAIITEPLFSPRQDYYTNLGGLGMVIAHEMGHAFDSNCIAFDQNGNYNPSWIISEDIQTLESRNEAAIHYFEDNFTVFGVYHVDGEQTLGENYADLGAMECISRIPHTQEQREAMFTNYAVIWGGKELDTAVIDQIDTDEHSPSVIRVNAILSTVEVFYSTYNVTEGDGMYIAPENRISRWY